MNRWLYRAAGTAGIAGGFLLLGAGIAHADQAGEADPDALLGDAFSPTSGLPPLDLTGGVPGRAAGTGGPRAGEVGADLVRVDGAEPVGLSARVTGTGTGTLPTVPAAPVAALPPAGDALDAPLLPALIGEQLASEAGFTPGLLTAAPVPELLGVGLPLSHLFGAGALPGQLPAVDPAGGDLPVPGGAAPTAPTAPSDGTGPVRPATSNPSTERPIAGEDPEFTGRR